MVTLSVLTLMDPDFLNSAGILFAECFSWAQMFLQDTARQ